jgi:phosphate transport system substrate-binding protein
MHMKNAAKTSAVSPIVATLVLIVVAVVGAVAVGTIMGSFSNSVAKQTDAGKAASASQTEILTGGSTTVQPASEQMAKVYMAANPGVKITVTGGASQAGVTQTASGVLDIGASSDLTKITDWQTAHPSDDLRYTQIGGSGVVWVANGALGSVNVKKSDLYKLYHGDIANLPLTGTTTTITGAKPYQRGDSSGTEEAAAKWLTNVSGIGPGAIAGVTQVKSLDAFTTAAGANANSGMLSTIQTTSNAVGFLDMGFAFDSSGNPVSGITVLNLTDDTMSGSPIFTTTKTNIQNALKNIFGGGKDSSTSYPADPKDSASLVRGLFYITKGAPTPIVADFINFAASPQSCDAMHAAGVFCNADLV